MFILKNRLLMIFASCLMLSSLFSCNNEETTPVNTSVEKQYYFNNENVKKEHLNFENDSLRIVYNLQDSLNVYCFDNSQDFQAFFKNNSNARVSALTNEIFQKDKLSNQLHAYIKLHKVDEEFEKSGVLPQHYIDFETKIKNDVVSNNRISSGTTVILYENSNFSGSTKTGFIIPYSTLGSMNNKASSVRIIGGGSMLLCDKKWFSGAKCYLFGVAYGEFPNLQELNFNDKAESYL